MGRYWDANEPLQFVWIEMNGRSFGVIEPRGHKVGGAYGGAGKFGRVIAVHPLDDDDRRRVIEALVRDRKQTIAALERRFPAPVGV